jgi:hypothetical protein
MDIYSISGRIILQVEYTQDSNHEEEMMKSNFVKVVFNLGNKIILPVGAYVVLDGIKYSLLDQYTPTQKGEDLFYYEPEFQSPEMVLGRVPLVLHTKDINGNDVDEYDWTITDKASNILEYVCLAINDYFDIDTSKDVGWGYKISGELPASETCSFSSVDILSGLSSMASTFDSEYVIHLEDRIIYFGKNLSFGDQITLKVGDTIQYPSEKTNKKSYYNIFVVK